MRGIPRRATWLFASALIGGFGLSLGSDTASGKGGADARDSVPAEGRRLVLVELFTSQGCSSCPPADQLLAKLGEDAASGVVPLSFHVDYWNRAGWTDPFSREDWSERQLKYAKALGLGDRIYTPQAVVDGRKELVGSNETQLRAAIAQAQTRPAGKISIHLEPNPAKVAVTADVDIPDSLRNRKLDLMISEYERGLVTAVGKGENSGHTLHDEYVVRKLERFAKIASGGSAHTQHTATLPLEKDWNQRRLGIAVFLQDPASLEIYGATSQDLGHHN